jgi:hypothetical protein
MANCGDERNLLLHIRLRILLLAETPQYAVPQFAEFVIQVVCTT